MDLSEKSNKMDDLSMSVEGQSPSAGEESGSAMIESHGSCENEASGVESTKIPVDSLSESAMQSVSQQVQSVSQHVQPAFSADAAGFWVVKSACTSGIDIWDSGWRKCFVEDKIPRKIFAAIHCGSSDDK
eukprot:815242_1